MGVCLTMQSVWAARIYNYDAPAAQQSLDRLNADYWLNLDVVLLQSGDRCAGDTDFALCATRTYSDTAQLLYAIDLTQRRMESLTREWLAERVLPTRTLLEFEQATTPLMAQEAYSDAIVTYTQQVSQYLDQTCREYAVTPCRIDSLDEAISARQRATREQSAQTVSKFVRRAVWALIWLVLFLTLRRVTNQWIVRSRHRRYLRELKKNTDFLRMQIDQDANLFTDDRESLLDRIRLLVDEIQDTQSQSARLIAQRIEQNDLYTTLRTIQTDYTDMIMTLDKVDDLIEQREQLRKQNI